MKQGNVQQVKIKGQKNIIALLKTDVKGDEWNIDFDRCISTKQQVELFITVHNLKELAIEGSGEVMSKGIIKGDLMELSIDGSGSIDLGLDVKELQTDVNGSGDVILRGKSKLHQLEINGSGDIAAYDLSTDESNIEINGSGDVKVSVSYALEVEINGSGDVYYKGEVKEIKSDINGSGKLHQEE